jgi:thymidylate synthase ThyX
MSSQFPGRYEPGLGIVVPPAIIEVGLQKELEEVAYRSEELYHKIKEAHQISAAPDQTGVEDYCLTNAHRRAVRVDMNLRELYHFCRLRCDGHAQWDIRGLADYVCARAKELAPITTMLLCGKDQFQATRGEVYGR